MKLAFNQKLRALFRRWFGQRMPVADQVQLNQRSTYILPTGAGFFVMIVVVLMMIGATNYQNNLAFILSFLLVGIGLVCIVFTFKNLQGVSFNLFHQGENFVDQPIKLRLKMQSLTATPHYSLAVGIDEQLDKKIKRDKTDREKRTYVQDVTAEGETEVVLLAKSSYRGYWQPPRIRISSNFPFGWFNCWAYFQFKSPLLIYPKPIEPSVTLSTATSGDESEQGIKAKGSEDLYGLKNFQQGESLSRVDWKSYARERGMFIREFASQQSQQLSFDWYAFNQVDNETKLSYLTYLVLNAASQNLAYSMILPNITIAINDSEQHKNDCLKALALFGLDKNHNDDIIRNQPARNP
jgi:uncharacterized protein (DUF58 family)